MIKVNIVGDFFSPSLSGLRFGDELQKQLDDADFNVVNFEGPVHISSSDPMKKSGPNISQDIKSIDFLKSNNFNIFSLANNHTMDYGEKALEATMSSLSDETIVGAGTWDEAYQVRVVEMKGQKIGFLAITQYEFGILDDITFCKNRKGAAWMGHPDIDKLIVSSKQYCDYLIVLPHAGLEYFTLPLPEIRTLYRHFIDMGADAVIAGHPHVPQPWEIYRKKTIVYSLGNFCFDEECDKPLWRDGLVSTLQFKEDQVVMNLSVVHFDAERRIVDTCHDAAVYKFLEADKKIFDDEKAYMDAVDAHCLSMQPYYEMLLEMGGYSHLSFKHCLGYLKRWILRKQPQPSTSHFINCVRCESHRWVLSRIYDLNNNIEK